MDAGVATFGGDSDGMLDANGLPEAVRGVYIAPTFPGGEQNVSGWADFFFFKQKTAYDIGLGIPAEPLFRSNHFYRSAHKFEQICRHRLRRQNVGYSNFSQPQSHLSFCVLLQYLVERRRVVTQLGKLD